MTSIHEYRGQHVEDELNSYAEKVGYSAETEGYLTAAGDMIADVLHVVAARTGLPPADVLRACRFGISHFAATHGMTVDDHVEGDIGHDSHIEISVQVAGELWTTMSSDEHLDSADLPVIPRAAL